MIHARSQQSFAVGCQAASTQDGLSLSNMQAGIEFFLRALEVFLLQRPGLRLARSAQRPLFRCLVTPGATFVDLISAKVLVLGLVSLFLRMGCDHVVDCLF